MPLNRPNPFGINVTGPIPLGSNEVEEKRVITKVVADGLKADQDRAGWLDRQKILSKLRYGLRPRVKNFPFKGASNLSIPLIDSTIRKYKPLKMRLMVEPDPIVEFQGDDPQAVDAERDAEETYNWLFKTHMDALEPMAYVIDYESHRGFAFAQVAWDYRTELECRSISIPALFPQGLPGTVDPQTGQPLEGGEPDPQGIAQVLAELYEIQITDPRSARSLNAAVGRIVGGEQFVKVAFRRVISDKPCVIDRDPVQIIMPARSTDVRNAEWIIVQHVLSMRRLEQMEADGYFQKGVIEKIKSEMTRADALNTGRGSDNAVAFTHGLQTEKEIEDRRTQIWGVEDEGNILVWECFHWVDIDNDGLADRAHTWIHPRSNTKLVSRPYLMPFHQWPLVKFDFEKTSRRWHSPRGISALLEGFQREVNAQHNARIDSMTLRNAPVYQIPAIAGFKARNFRVVPGTVIQTPPGARLEPLLQDRSAFPEQVAEEQQLRGIAENYVGTFDAVLSNPLQVQKARTATEIQAATQFASSTANFDTILFQLSMRELHEMIWKLWIDLGPQEIWIKVLGDQGTNVPKLIKKADIDRSFKLIPTGTIANTNRALELAHAREALQLYLDDQSGFINPFELRRWHINLLAFRQARRILLPPQQAAELNTMRQAAAEVNNNPELQALISGDVFNVPPEEQERQVQLQLPRDTQTGRL
jgi:hypothetical protein